MKLRVELDWRTTLATALLLPTLLSLGFWQLDRADEKAALIDRLEARRALPAITPQSALRLPGDERADRQVVMDARFTPNRFVLLDNRLRGGKFGYEVVAFAEVDQLAVALNLGWVRGDPSRQTLPTIVLPSGVQTVSGRLYQPSGDAFMLGENRLPAQFPSVVQQLTLPLGKKSFKAGSTNRSSRLRSVLMSLNPSRSMRLGRLLIKHRQNIRVMPSNGLLWRLLWVWPLFFVAPIYGVGCGIASVDLNHRVSLGDN